jgi:hypothetical protein
MRKDCIVSVFVVTIRKNSESSTVQFEFEMFITSGGAWGIRRHLVIQEQLQAAHTQLKT